MYQKQQICYNQIVSVQAAVLKAHYCFFHMQFCSQIIFKAYVVGIKFYDDQFRKKLIKSRLNIISQKIQDKQVQRHFFAINYKPDLIHFSVNLSDSIFKPKPAANRIFQLQKKARKVWPINLIFLYILLSQSKHINQANKNMIKRSCIHLAKIICYQKPQNIQWETHSQKYLTLYQTQINLSHHFYKNIYLFSTNKTYTITIQQSQVNYKKYNLQVKQVDSQNVIDSIDLASRNFSQFQPLRQVFYNKFPCQLSKRIQIHSKYFLQYKYQFIDNQLSKVAYQKDNLTNKNIVKSVMLAKDYTFVPSTLNNYMNSLNIFSSLNALYVQTKRSMKPQWAGILNQAQRGKIAHFWLGATVPQLLSAKIFSRLMIKGEQKAIEKGYQYIVVWATNNKSGKISQKLNYKCISSVDTHTLRVFGQRPFELTPQQNRFCSVWGKCI